MKRFFAFIFVGFCLTFLAIFALLIFPKLSAPKREMDLNSRAHFQQAVMIKKAREEVDLGQYKNALKILDDALAVPGLRDVAFDRAFALSTKVSIYLIMSDYENAKKIFTETQKWYPDDHLLMAEFQQIDALLEYTKTMNADSVYAFIENLKKLRKQSLPPVNIDGGTVATIFRLYDVIGDYDAGIALANECISFYHKVNISKGLKPVDAIDYVRIRTGFEESKRGERKICGDGGKTCIGRATHAILQSDTLPW